MKPSEFFKGDCIKEIEDKTTWDNIKDVDCILFALRERSPFYKHAYAGYKGKYWLIAFHSRHKLIIDALPVTFEYIKSEYNKKSYDYVSQEMDELLVVDGI